MKKVIIKTLEWQDDENGRIVDEAGLQNIQENIIVGRFGKPERWSNSDEGLPERVIEIRNNEQNPEVIEYHLPADYTIEIIDLDLDPVYLLQVCQDNRKKAYPKIEDYVDAKVKQSSSDINIVNEGIAQEQEYLAACLAVKLQYPKP